MGKVSFPWGILLVVFCICFLPSSTYAKKDSKFTTHNLKYLSVAIPESWEIIDKEVMEQIDTGTEALTGVPQGNNEILLAASCYTKDKYPSATFRVSFRHKKSPLTQDKIKNFGKEDLDMANDFAVRSLKSAIKKTNNSFSVNDHVTYKDVIGGKTAIASSYILKYTDSGVENVSYLYVVFYEKGILKINMTYRKDEKYFSFIFDNIIKSVKIL